ncbi:MAG: precorrin-3B C(17)-methyltransferase [Fusobacterium sp.]|uniref:precorrin-3B C(17)-methyltransferase n=1 Tax=Fusobacterium sp. TaxID=68766 RepID=UPI0026DDB05A|nr:precorrin-3B C(17)-methyltransferase [Fusobacterium sp.]MDO4691034.1 precorrin-3B C(17)-methyltransferase [Fusobacterium sp.]
MNRGKIFVVGIGPGNMEDISRRAYSVLKDVDIIAGYTTYINLIKDEFSEKEFYSSGMKKEIERCQEVLELAKSGKKVALISSGDSGIYGMAGIMLEVALNDESGIEVEVIPGITSTIAGAALVGAPLMHDQAIISLSDLLTDWEVIKKRIDCASQGDFIISLYNPKSKTRVDQIVEARDIMLKYKKSTTPVALLRHIGREDENYTLTTLEDFLNFEIDMFTIVTVGNSNTYIKDGKMITPRGYTDKYTI